MKTPAQKASLALNKIRWNKPKWRTQEARREHMKMMNKASAEAKRKKQGLDKGL